MTDIDWKKASDDQLAAAAAEAKRRQPLSGFDDIRWGDLTHSEFSAKKNQVFAATRAGNHDTETRSRYVELESRKQEQDQ